MNNLMAKGAIPEKTVLGVPFYGRAFLLQDTNQAGIMAKSQDVSFGVSTYCWGSYYYTIMLRTL